MIPVYNVQNHIGITLKSLCAQKRRGFEIIIVNDGSTDNSMSIVKKFIDDNDVENIKVISKRNGGVSSARNVGITEACGEYILFLDGDDYISQELMDVLYKELQDILPDIIYWGYNVVTEDKITIREYPYLHIMENHMDGVDILTKIIADKKTKIWTGNAAYRKEFLIKYNLKYTEGCVAGEDLEFTYKALSNAKDVIFINRVLSYYVQRQGSITYSYNIRRFDSFTALERVYRYFQDTNKTELRKLADIIKNESLIKNYTGTYRLCLDGLVIHKRMSPREAVKIINTDLERNYPKLNMRIKTMIKYHKTKSLSKSVQIRVFKLSPLAYYYLAKLRALLSN